MRSDFFRPLPVKSEAISGGPKPAGSGAVVLLDPETADDLTVIIDESERLLSADDLYRDAVEGLELERQSKVRSRPASVPQPSMQLWGAGTSGVPRKGSRTIRLFHASPEHVAHAVRLGSTSGRLRLSSCERRLVSAESEWPATGQLYGSFRLRPSVPVEVSVRVARFNRTFAAVELKLESKRHPRRFFRAAHDAIGALDLPGH